VSDEDQLDQWLETCQSAAHAGGRELVAWRGHFQTREKAPTDLVTDADLAAQGAVREVIAASFPQHTFVGEEQPPGNRSLQADEYVWVVDPLDGTTNYVHGYPSYAVSVALTRAGEPLVGVIYDPLTEETFVAVKGLGAWCNGERMQTSQTKALDQALVAVSFPPRVQRNSPDLLDFVEVAQICQGVRRTGSAALNLAYVARGQLDAFWADLIHPWDVAAGVLLVREAGGLVTGRDGGEFDLWNPHFMAAAGPPLHAALLQVLTPYKRSHNKP
jgi:myo-inositol-1(or 4)-monophosphatase